MTEYFAADSAVVLPAKRSERQVALETIKNSIVAHPALHTAGVAIREGRGTEPTHIHSFFIVYSIVHFDSKVVHMYLFESIMQQFVIYFTICFYLLLSIYKQYRNNYKISSYTTAQIKAYGELLVSAELDSDPLVFFDSGLAG